MRQLKHKVEAALVFRVTSGHSGKTYFVDPSGPHKPHCTCEAGQNRVRCSHLVSVEAFALKALEGK